MGTVSLILPSPKPKGDIYFAGGYDFAPLPTESYTKDNQLVLSRNDTDSGFVMTPWNIPGIGQHTISTATLRQRSEPYRLSVELVRGKLNALRNQSSEW
jgi:hypothetical protein